MVHSHASYRYSQLYHKVRFSDLCSSCYISTTLPTASPKSACLPTTVSLTDKSGHMSTVSHYSRTSTSCITGLIPGRWPSIAKCNTMTISRKRERPTLQYKLGDERLSTVESFTYHGVTICSDLRWREHVHNISAKATRVLNFVRRNIYHCTSEVEAVAYTSLIRPHLEYASAVMGSLYRS